MPIIKALTQKYPFSYSWREVLRYRYHNILAILFPRWWCGRCRSFSRTVDRRHMHTCYPDPESNYTTTCISCFEEIEEEWDSLWEEYYGSRF